jgi:hypothetical protein
MRTPAALLLALAATHAFAAGIVVFGETDFYPVGEGAPSAAPADPARAAFYRASRADLASPGSLESAMTLVSPPAWGKTVGPSTRGEIRFHPSFAGGFECRLSLQGLVPLHRYILTLNGNPSRPGNGLLPSGVPGNEREKYYDFLIVTTDGDGRFDSGLGVFLKPGDYSVRCYVKDTDDFKIVLYRDFFDFRVTAP